MIDFQLCLWDLHYVEDIAKFANNPNIGKGLRDGFPYPYSREDAEVYIKSCIEKEGEIQFCRAILVEGRAIGSIGVFRNANVYRYSAEIGYWLAEEYWGKGITTRAVIQLCSEIFDETDIVRIYAEVFSFNDSSKRVLEKAGFILEGTMRKAIYKNGKFWDHYMFALIK